MRVAVMVMGVVPAGVITASRPRFRRSAVGVTIPQSAWG